MGFWPIPEKLLSSQEAPRKPNLVFVFPDQMRHFSWPGGGDAQVRTPNLEAMAREGVTFSHAISNHPLCSPYRASLLTGRYQQAHGVAQNVGAGGGLPISEITIANVLKKAGYATGYVGKWHLYPNSLEGGPVPPGPHRHGFDYWRAAFNYRERYRTKYYDDNGKVVVLPDYAPKCQMDQTLEFIEKKRGRTLLRISFMAPAALALQRGPEAIRDLYSSEKMQLRPNVQRPAPRVRGTTTWGTSRTFRRRTRKWAD